MLRRKKRPDPERRAQILAEARRLREEREQGYREQALKLYPHVCGRCGREFSGKDMRELTVHHRDGNHMNNPPDGSNWELLCLYCHDNEHQTPVQRAHYNAGQPMGIGNAPTLHHNPFESLQSLLPPEEAGEGREDVEDREEES